MQDAQSECSYVYFRWIKWENMNLFYQTFSLQGVYIWNRISNYINTNTATKKTGAIWCILVIKWVIIIYIILIIYPIHLHPMKNSKPVRKMVLAKVKKTEIPVNNRKIPCFYISLLHQIKIVICVYKLNIIDKNIYFCFHENTGDKMLWEILYVYLLRRFSYIYYLIFQLRLEIQISYVCRPRA